MANVPESAVYDAGIYQLEITDPVQGGSSGVSNAQAKNLANRTAYLKQHVDALESTSGTLAPLNSPTFTGAPSGPTAAPSDSSAQFATTAYVKNVTHGTLTKSVAGGVNVTLTADEASYGIINLTGAITANISVILPTASHSYIIRNSTTGAFQVTIKTAAGAGVVVAQGFGKEVFCDGTNIKASTDDLADLGLTGSPTAPTPPSGDASTRLANMAAVFTAADGLAPVNVAGNAAVTLTQTQYGNAILGLSGALTGNINLIFPAQSGQWIVSNNSTGAFNITAKTASGTGVVLPQASAILVYCDGVNIYAASATGSQTSFRIVPITGVTGSSLTVPGGYTVGGIFIGKNGGSLMEPGAGNDYTATDGSTIGLAVPATSTDKYFIYAFVTFTVANAVLKSGDTMAGPLLLYGNPSAALEAASKQYVDTAFAASPSVQGTFKNLKASASGTSATITVSADEIIVESIANVYQTLRAVSLTGSLASVGANGLDTGTVAVLTWYFKFIIWNGTTAALLLSLSATAPTMPAGYTHKALIGAVQTDTSVNKYPFSYKQVGKRVQYVIAAGSNVPQMRGLFNGVTGTYSLTTPTWAAISINSVVPPNASEIIVVASSQFNNGTVGNCIAAPNNSYGGPSSSNFPPVYCDAGLGRSSSPCNLLLESINIYAVGDQAGSALSCLGFVLNI